MVQPISTEQVRIHMWVSGSVQGVGFRNFVQQSATSLNLKGWVRNVGYDAVEMMAEGSFEALTKFADSVKTGPRAARVEKIRIEWDKASGEFQDFRVKYAI
jgi:acylphosphatase